MRFLELHSVSWDESGERQRGDRVLVRPDTIVAIQEMYPHGDRFCSMLRVPHHEMTVYESPDEIRAMLGDKL